MPKFRIYGRVVATKYIGEFEADTKEQAERMAWDSDEAYVSVCHQCSKEVEDPEIRELEVEEVNPQ
ncbi:hypothetical protein [Paenibacillus sp. FSL R7-0128]|uniref:hypothetical protein n=1 Tax=Paenibacillus sp. FSL R7-0128 TaxID=2954529 RepID=UPI0030FA595E